MSEVFVSAKITESVNVWSGTGVLSHLVYVGNYLSLSLPYDAQKRKEALLWLATQLEQEARKI